jgi:hypothetical protein
MTGPKGVSGDTFAYRGYVNRDPGTVRESGTLNLCTIGEILLTATGLAPIYPADGRLIQIADNEALFQVIGTTYGGDGQQTYAVPDLRGLAPRDHTYSICAFGIFPQAL